MYGVASRLCADVKASDGEHAFKGALRNSLSRLFKNVTLRRLGRKYSYRQHEGIAYIRDTT